MASPPWVSINLDHNGIPVVTVKEGDLDVIPKFMHFILQNKVGMEQGIFKVRFLDGVGSLTSPQEILTFVQEHFTEKVQDGKKWKARKVSQQHFFHGSDTDHLYGCLKRGSTNQEQNIFLETIRDADSFFSNESTCCLQALSVSERELERHYWQTIRQLCSQSFDLGCISKIDEQKIKEQTTDTRLNYCYIEDSCTESVSHSLASLLQRGSGVKSRSILYADNIPVVKTKFNITPKFSLSDCKTIIDVHPQTLPGLTFPYLYVGMSHATFPWQIKEAALFSLNYLHFGAPCVWFVVPPSHYKRFVDLIQYMPLDMVQVKCSYILGHKYFVASRDFLKKFNIATHTVVQKAGEVVITYPFAAHMGYNTGRNLSENKCFGDQWWVEPAILAPTCKCFPFQINMDLKEIIAVARPHLLKMYLLKDMHGLFRTISGNNFISKLDLLPEAIQNNSTEICFVEAKQKASGQKRVNWARCVLVCPAEDCNKTFLGGRGKLYRVENHIRKTHLGKQDLISKLHYMYPRRKCISKEWLCPTCNQIIHGDAFNIKLHMTKRH